jgi:hypothetical protein
MGNYFVAKHGLAVYNLTFDDLKVGDNVDVYDNTDHKWYEGQVTQKFPNQIVIIYNVAGKNITVYLLRRISEIPKSPMTKGISPIPSTSPINPKVNRVLPETSSHITSGNNGSSGTISSATGIVNA